MNHLELRTAMLDRLGEDAAAPVYYLEPEVTRALNAAQQLFAFLTLCLEKSVVLPLDAGVNYYRLFSETSFGDYLVPLRVRVAGAGGAKLTPVRLADLAAVNQSWETEVGTPTAYAALGFDLFVVYPHPAGAMNLSITYAYCPPALVGNSDVPRIPDEHHSCLIDAAVVLARLKEGGSELVKEIPRFERFLKSAAKMAAYVRTRSLGQRYDRLPFELSNYNASKLLDVVKAIGRSKPALLRLPQTQEK